MTGPAYDGTDHFRVDKNAEWEVDWASRIFLLVAVTTEKINTLPYHHTLCTKYFYKTSSLVVLLIQKRYFTKKKWGIKQKVPTKNKRYIKPLISKLIKPIWVHLKLGT